MYFDLATWHLINTVYQPQRVAELRAMRAFYGDARHHRRLLAVIDGRFGHELLARAEAAKIEVAADAPAHVDLALIEPGLSVTLTEGQAGAAIESELERIVAAAQQTVADAGLRAADVDALYFTGGSTGLRPLAQRIRAAFGAARAVSGDRFASVARGLGVHAARRFGDSSTARG